MATPFLFYWRVWGLIALFWVHRNVQVSEGSYLFSRLECMEF